MFVASGERPKSKVSIKQEVKVKYSFLQNQSRYKVSREHSKKLSVHFYSVNFTLKIKLIFFSNLYHLFLFDYILQQMLFLI